MILKKLHTIKRILSTGSLSQSIPRLIRISLIYFERKLYYDLYFRRKFNPLKPVLVNNRYKMFLSKDDVGLSADVYSLKSREPILTEYMLSNITKNDICLDIGANLGYYALLEAMKGAKVFAIEPVSSTYNLLVKNCMLNKYPIITYNIGVGATTGTGYIEIRKAANVCAITDIKSENTETIQLYTIDSIVKNLMKKVPTVIRMDIEGFEIEAFKGAKKTLQAMKFGSKLVLELHVDLIGEIKARNLISFLNNNGFEVRYMMLEPAPSERRNIILGVICPLLNKLSTGIEFKLYSKDELDINKMLSFNRGIEIVLIKEKNN